MMSISVKLREYLDQNKIKYSLITHSAAYTAQELAHKMHISGLEIAKVVIFKMDGRFAMAVMPAPHQIDLDRLKEATGAQRIELATEREFRNLFPDCEVGAMPPFGNLYGLPIYVAKPLEKDEYIVFNAGSHTDAIRMEYTEFTRLANPIVIDYTTYVVPP
jgi:Ala-tRNA(Pro) deacylase